MFTALLHMSYSAYLIGKTADRPINLVWHQHNVHDHHDMAAYTSTHRAADGDSAAQARHGMAQRCHALMQHPALST